MWCVVYENEICLGNGNARVFIGGVEVYMAVCLRCLCGGMMEKQLGQHVKAGIACEDAGISM